MFVQKESNPVSNKTTLKAVEIKARSGVGFAREATTQKKSVGRNRRKTIMEKIRKVTRSVTSVVRSATSQMCVAQRIKREHM